MGKTLGSFTFFLMLLSPLLVTPKVIHKRSTVCYDALGCFSNGGVFHQGQRILSVTPQSPDTVRTRFELFTRQNLLKAQHLDARKVLALNLKSIWSRFRNTRQTKVIIHGFLDNIDLTSWMTTMKRELLRQGDYNVIVVDWHRGSFNLYTIATANTRLVGAQVATLIKQLVERFNVSASSFHLIGHSLGAHTAGYAGERIVRLGRITGLDPAGPYFEGSDVEVRLDKSDAMFVDVIHTDAKSLLRGAFGMVQTVGHADFYPNLGHDQPGCAGSPLRKLTKYGLVEGPVEIVACNHLRSIKFFIESINSKCPFLAFPFSNGYEFMRRKVHSCPSNKCLPMGFHADQKKPLQPTTFFLYTSKAAPFCEYHLDIQIALTDKQHSTTSSERGDLKIQVHGDKTSTDLITLTSSPEIVSPGDKLDFHVAVGTDVGHVTSADFTWHHSSKFLHPWKWNVLGLRHPKLTLHEIVVKREEARDEVHLCAKDRSVETDETLKISTIC